MLGLFFMFLFVAPLQTYFQCKSLCCNFTLDIKRNSKSSQHVTCMSPDYTSSSCCPWNIHLCLTLLLLLTQPGNFSKCNDGFGSTYKVEISLDLYWSYTDIKEALWSKGVKACASSMLNSKPWKHKSSQCHYNNWLLCKQDK